MIAAARTSAQNNFYWSNEKKDPQMFWPLEKTNWETLMCRIISQILRKEMAKMFGDSASK